MTRKELANDLAVAEDIGKGKAEAIIATLFDAIRPMNGSLMADLEIKP